jgi:glycosyltransferase involved in cell wall biosynthesis
MKIGIDARLVVYRRGMGNYAYHLLNAFAESGVDFEFTIYADDRAASLEVPADPRFKIQILRPAIYPIWEQYSLPRRAQEDRLDVLHCLSNTGPLLWSGALVPRVVVTIHDVMFLLPHSIVPRTRTLYHELGRRYRSLVAPRLGRLASHVITDSVASAADIARTTAIPAGKIRVIPLAPNPAFDAVVPPGQDADVATRYGVTSPYLFALGAADPRKNSERIIRAFALLKQSNFPHVLVMSGLPPRAKKGFGELASKLGIASSVLLTGFIPENDLLALYRGASLLAYPSIYEGFGFPILEANACGTPVVTSNRGSLAEVAGDASVCVDPLDVGDLARGFRRVLSDEGLREALIARGHSNRMRFSWAKVAEATLQVYRETTEPSSMKSVL